MPVQVLTPAAEYVTTSTDDQPNSIPIQKEAIRSYAAKHGLSMMHRRRQIVSYRSSVVFRPCAGATNYQGRRQMVESTLSVLLTGQTGLLGTMWLLLTIIRPHPKEPRSELSLVRWVLIPLGMSFFAIRGFGNADRIKRLLKPGL